MYDSNKQYKDYLEEYIKDQQLYSESKLKIDDEISKIHVNNIKFCN